jgi:hypothetical protein
MYKIRQRVGTLGSFMTLSKFLAATADHLDGTPVHVWHVDHAIRRGCLKPAGRYPDGYRRFSDANVLEMVAYMRGRSHTYREAVHASQK